MLKFIDENDFLLVDKYKQNDDGSVNWTYKDDDTTHSGFLREGMTRLDGEKSIDVWAKFQTQISKGKITVEGDTNEEIAAREVELFKASRQSQLDAAIVTTSTGKNFDANEKSITRLHNAVTYIKEHDVESIPWSTADVDSGVMVECTAVEIIEAHRLAVENMTAIWAFMQE